ncbi:divalent-cation tolerance protein CutA [Pukyongiella litopenaei]|uniref:Divalent-cation tolerance protein CutA n=1 Tax=Pukyongiella litopenaei TaxID=2605946 RepID=A0A2S0MPH5_9RHOB|nr:divalent-cation tolerance protein CutA [Pukyongiella litopenaei]AVO37613.1 divalent-cation tolerance protein CutA [Pukyongiella litopenaei]
MPLVAFLVNCPDADTADAIADALIAARLVACSNRHAPIRSRYRWQGEIETAEEHPLLLKTRPDLADRVEAEIARLHPYDVPPILRMTMQANAAYLDWIAAETTA